MAKEAKKAAPATQEKKGNSTEETVVDDIKNMNKQTESTVQAALDEIEKEKDEKKKEEAKRTIKRCEYKNKRALLDLRRRRAEDRATKEYLEATKETLDQYLGGKLTAIEANEKDQEDVKKMNDEFNKIDREYNKNVSELREAYPGYWSYDWDNRFRG